MGLNDIRAKIDLIDFEIVKLLNRRFEYALRTRNLKQSVEDPAREREILEAGGFRSDTLVRAEFSRRLFEQVLQESKSLQSADRKIIGFQGEHGAYSEIAAYRIDPAGVTIPCASFVEVFEAVGSGQFDFGVVPVENSIEGAVHRVNDLLIETDLRIAGETRIPVHHCLLGLPETHPDDIRVVFSHPQALGQCRGYLQRHQLEARPYYDTSGAAMMLSKERPRATAAIASELCAELYGLRILQRGIEDHPANSTRFILLTKSVVADDGDKCSIVFSTPHRAGALLSILSRFSEAGINLTRIESRPVRTDPGRYAFLLDFEGARTDPAVQSILPGIERDAVLYKFLGCYRELGILPDA